MFLSLFKCKNKGLAIAVILVLTPFLSLLFANVEGKPIDPGVLSYNFAKIVKRGGLENVRFHDLRHTFASLMLLRGAKPKIISEALGHSSVAFTIDVYSHIIEGMQQDAMALLDGILPKAKNGAF